MGFTRRAVMLSVMALQLVSGLSHLQMLRQVSLLLLLSLLDYLFLFQV